MSIITAEQARSQANSFDMSQEQVLQNISFTIDANSKAGATSIIMQYLKSAVSQQELDGALNTIRSNGYTVDMIDTGANSEHFAMKINW